MSDYASTVIWVEIISAVITAIIFGCITKAINGSKGRDGGFAWGFWLGVIGIIVVACRPSLIENSYPQNQPYYGYQPQRPALESETKKDAPDESVIISNLYSNMYIPEGPILLKSSILKMGNNQIFITNNFKNISDKVISAIQLDIIGMDPFDTISDTITDYVYLDMNLEPQKYSGNDKKIILGSGRSRKAKIVLKTVLFSDNTKWSCSDCEWVKDTTIHGFDYNEHKNEIERRESCKEVYEYLKTLNLDDDPKYLAILKELEKRANLERTYGVVKGSASRIVESMSSQD